MMEPQLVPAYRISARVDYPEGTVEVDVPYLGKDSVGTAVDALIHEVASKGFPIDQLYCLQVYRA